MNLSKFEAAASATPPSAPGSPSTGYPTDGNPATPVPATVPGEYWFYQIQAEIANVLSVAGVTADHTNLTQLATAIQALNGMPKGYLSPYTVANNGTTSVDIGAVSCRSDDNTTDIVVSALTKSLSGTWVAGNSQNALDAGGAATSNGTLHVYAIKNTTSGATDFLFSASASSPTLPGSYNKKRWLFALRLNSSTQFIPFVYQGGDTFVYTTAVADMTTAAVGTSASLVSLSVPVGVQVELLGRAGLTGTTTAATVALVTSPDESDQAPSSDHGDMELQVLSQAIHMNVRRRTNTSGQLRFRASAASCQASFRTYGYRILR